MTQILTPSLTISESCLVRKVRELPVVGVITKAVGEVVNASDVVASAELSGDLEIVRVSELLGLEPFETQQCLKVSLGQAVQSNQLLAQHSGLFGLLKSEVRCSASGIVEFYAERTGHLGIRLPAKHIELKAYISGKVVEVIPGKSLTIESSAALVQGIFGVGGERTGNILMLDIAVDRVVEDKDIPEDCSNRILVGGMRPTFDALKAASVRGAVGFVTGSIDDVVLRQYVGYDVGVAVTGDEALSMSLVITEGFGEIPLSDRAFSILKKVNNYPASLNGTTQVRAGAVRPEIVVCINNISPNLSATSMAGLQVGCSIRLIRYPYFGKRAIVVEMPHAPEVIETGAVARILRAKLESGDIITVPRANVELM